jgi:lysophospholipase L1-like esterase
VYTNLVLVLGSCILLMLLQIPIGNSTNGNSTGTFAASNGTDVTFGGPAVAPLEGSDAGDDAEERAAPAAESPIKPVTFSSIVTNYLTTAPEAVQQFAQTPLFQGLLERVQENVLVDAFDGINQLFAKQAEQFANAYANPLANLNQAMGNVTRGVLSGVGTAGMKGAVSAIEAAEPVLSAGLKVTKGLQPAAKESKAFAEKLAAQSEKMVEESLKALPIEQQQQIRAAEPKVQAGRRMLL